MRDQAIVGATLACLLVVGAILVFRVPPMAGFDEPFHWRRALQLADGHPFARRLGPNDYGGPLDGRALAFEGRADQTIAAPRPMSVPEMADLAGSLSRAPPAMTPSSFPSTGSFSPLAYAPAAVGIAAAHVLRLDLLSTVRAGRLANLVAYLGLIWCLLRFLPAGRLPVLALLGGPTALHLATSYSADPVCTLLPLLLVACCLRLHIAPVTRPFAWLATIVCLCLAVGLLKPILFVTSVSVLLVPSALFATRRRALSFRVASAALCVGASLAWNAAYPFVPGRYWHTGAEPGQALHTLLAHPLRGIAILATNGWNDLWFWWVDGWARFGGGPGPYHFTTPESLAGLFLGLLAALVLADHHPARRRPNAALLLVLIAGLYVVLLLLAFLVGYGPPRATFIDGIQGRYLLLPECLLAIAGSLLLPARIGVRAVAATLLAGCMALSFGADIIALGRYAAVWH
jgi:uncharacterized membrane protein